MMNFEQWRTVWFQAVARAWYDPHFKVELVQDTRNTLFKHFDCHIPEQVKIHVLDTEGMSDIRQMSSGNVSLSETLELLLPPPPRDMKFQSLDPVADIRSGPCCC